MPNQIDANGIQIQTYAEIVSDIINGSANAPGYIQIYGSDINVASNSPDGQQINIYALAEKDTLDLIVATYNSFDPDQAVGVALDAIAQIAGLARKGGTYTEVNVNVTVTGSVTLDGLDTSTPFQIQDSTGNVFNLITTTALGAGTTSLAFRAQNVGFVQVLANTLTIPVTILANVSSVNNPAIAYQEGNNQETDSNFRLRRQASTAFPAQGPLQALYAGLNSIEDLVQAIVYENLGNIVDSDGIPAHGIWVICDGGTDDEVANAIYNYRSLGIAMKGSETVDITQVDGSIFTVKFDRVIQENLFLQFTLTAINGGTIDNTAIKNGLVANWLLHINQEADITTMAQKIREINPNVVVSAAGVSLTAGSYTDIVTPSTKQKKFVLTTAHIDIV